MLAFTAQVRGTARPSGRKLVPEWEWEWEWEWREEKGGRTREEGQTRPDQTRPDPVPPAPAAQAPLCLHSISACKDVADVYFDVETNNQESWQTIKHFYSHVEINTHNMLQALVSFIGDYSLSSCRQASLCLPSISDLRAKTLDFRVSDSSIILVVKVGIPRPTAISARCTRYSVTKLEEHNIR